MIKFEENRTNNVYKLDETVLDLHLIPWIFSYQRLPRIFEKVCIVNIYFHIICTKKCAYQNRRREIDTLKAILLTEVTCENNNIKTFN